MSIGETSLRYGESPWQRTDLYIPVDGGADRAVVVYHGGFWRHDRTARDLEPLAVALAARGCAVAAVEYRPVWDGGAWPAAAEDATAALRQVTALGGPWRDAVVSGHSAGAHLALSALAGRGTDRHAVLLAPVTDIAYGAELGVGDGAVGHFLAAHLAAGGALSDATPRPGPADLASLSVVTAGQDQAVPRQLSARQLGDWHELGLRPRHHHVAGARHMHVVNPARPGCAGVLELLSGTSPPPEEAMS